VLPADQGAAERAGLAWVVVVLEVGPELLDPLQGEFRVSVAIKLPDR
jgi:hypothetical protein